MNATTPDSGAFRCGRALIVALALWLAPQAADAQAADAPSVARVSLLSGSADVLRAGDEAKKESLAVGATLTTGDTVVVADRSFLEFTLPDRSVVSVAPRSRLTLERMHFKPTGERGFVAKLNLGSVWSQVTGVLGGEGLFEVKTELAVAGVRGTAFRVDAAADRSVTVSVFTGSVAVGKPGAAAPPAQPGERREKAPPREISKGDWEKLVLAQMKIRIAADGTPGDPERIAEADADDFSRFVQRRGKAKP